jgi:hypothetical protein
MIVAEGLTVTLVPVTVPSPGVIDSDVTPDTLQAREVELPAVIVDGVAVNEEMTGRATCVTVTVAVAVVLPPALVAVSV